MKQEFIMIEMGKAKFTIARKECGEEPTYVFVASCRSRYQALNLLKLLNKV